MKFKTLAACLVIGTIGAAYALANDDLSQQPGTSGSTSDQTTDSSLESSSSSHISSTMDTDQIRQVQTKLKEQGYDPGAVDGVMGKRTASALKSFQKDNDQTVTGSLDNNTLQSLGIQQAGMMPSGTIDQNQQTGQTGQIGSPNQNPPTQNNPQQPGTVTGDQNQQNSGNSVNGAGSTSGSTDGMSGGSAGTGSGGTGTSGTGGSR